jgi:hypothetical protein
MTGDSEKGDSSSSRHTVVERIFGSMGEAPKLTKTNYHEWALEMQVNMEGMKLWDAVESDNAERGKHRRALAFILHGGATGDEVRALREEERKGRMGGDQVAADGQ